MELIFLRQPKTCMNPHFQDKDQAHVLAAAKHLQAARNSPRALLWRCCFKGMTIAASCAHSPALTGSTSYPEQTRSSSSATLQHAQPVKSPHLAHLPQAEGACVRTASPRFEDLAHPSAGVSRKPALHLWWSNATLPSCL